MKGGGIFFDGVGRLAIYYKHNRLDAIARVC